MMHTLRSRKTGRKSGRRRFTEARRTVCGTSGCRPSEWTKGTPMPGEQVVSYFLNVNEMASAKVHPVPIVW